MGILVGISGGHGGQLLLPAFPPSLPAFESSFPAFPASAGGGAGQTHSGAPFPAFPPPDFVPLESVVAPVPHERTLTRRVRGWFDSQSLLSSPIKSPRIELASASGVGLANTFSDR